MEENIEDMVFSFKQSLLGSRNYYSVLWGRFRFLRALLWFLDAISIILVCNPAIDIGSWWARVTLFLVITLSAFKMASSLPQQIGDLEYQYHECQNILNALEQEITKDVLLKLKKRFSDVEKKDKPTIECLMAVCTNKALVALGLNQKYEMTWIESRLGPFMPFIKYDDHAKLVERI